MNVSYKGIKQELAPRIQTKIDAKFAKLSKLLEQRGEREAHVVVTQERHLYHAEVTVQFYDHQLVAIESDGELFTALNAASGARRSGARRLPRQFPRLRLRRRLPRMPRLRARAGCSA
jgi:ribosomal subunit interface protein